MPHFLSIKTLENSKPPNYYGQIHTFSRVAAFLKCHHWNSFNSTGTKWWKDKQKPLFHPLEVKAVKYS